MRETRNLDVRFCSTASGSDTAGPVTLKLLSYGRIKCLVYGAFREASEQLHHMFEQLANGRACWKWIRMACRDPTDAKAAIARYLYRSWGVEAVRAQACLKLGGLVRVCTGAHAAASRRALGLRSHRRAPEAYQLQHRGGRGPKR